MGDVLEFLVDGASGLSPGSVSGTAMVAGVCSKGTPGKAYLLGKRSNLPELLGVGPLVDALNDVLATGGQAPVVIAVPVVGTADPKAIGALSQTGEGPVVVAAGTVKAAAELVLKILKSGARNTGTYQLSLDGGDSWDVERTLPVDGAILAGSTGVTLTAPDSAMIAGTTYAWRLKPPVPSISGVMAALETPLERYDVEFVLIVGPSDSSDWAAAGAKADVLWNLHRPTYFKMAYRLPADGESVDDWTAAFKTDLDSYAHRFVQVCGAYGEVSDATGKRLCRNWAGLQAGRVISLPVCRATGRVKDGGISQGALAEDFNEAHQTILEKAGALTAKRYAGLKAAFWGDSRTLADATSDFQYEEVVRTVFKAVRLARIAALKSMYDEAGDPTLEDNKGSGLGYLKASIEAALATMTTARPMEMAAFVVEIPEGQDIVNNGVAVEIALIGLPIIRSIKLFARYVYAGSPQDPRLEAV